MAQGVEGLLIGGRFRLSHVLGTGGFGRVWAAKDIEFQTDVAIKELVLEQGLVGREREDRLSRARREARNAAKLRDHPHIVSVHDVVILDEAPWIVMQLVTGGTLQERLVKKKRLSVGRTGQIADALLRALQAAHQRGIVHRDVKPANVMETADRTILLTDFGIAISQGDSTLTATGMVIGSLPYLSPERAQGLKAQAPSDLFALGTTLYETVEGICPFKRESPAGSLHAVAYEDVPPMKRADRLQPLIEALLEKNPADRPTATEALELLKSSAQKVKRNSKSQFRPLPEPTAAPPAASKAAVRSTSAPKPKPKPTSGGRPRSDNKSQDSPTGAAFVPVDKKPSKESDWEKGAMAFLVILFPVFLLLYTGNNSFANWVSGGLDGDVASAEIGDCVHETSEGEWVEVACWSAATKYKVTVVAEGNCLTQPPDRTVATGTTSKNGFSLFLCVEPDD
ncbi:serine/threonine protein kinase [Streptomyces sp. YC504]|uniref:non-specific serine/threonine protein kinase n=1 Tax=Streptomyces mesophilus TaxID=1775132 RepID=A0A6G4XSI2_9ACTN|nr:serine/threonine-protein kinase [Streptomyces mesophilus]NGO80525.1 serine/threonine protein kinase [Streptomyces mesophilus]